MLPEKYAPNTLNGIVGNESAVASLTSFAEKIHRKETIKPMMLVGPSGIGKTSAARALAYSNSFELLELTASDYRDAASLNRTVIPASRSKSLFGKTILILLDEIDEISKKHDAGVEKVVGELVKNTRQPVIFTAEDYWDQNIRFLRGAVDKVEFKKVNTETISNHLKAIAAKEGKKIDDEVVAVIAKRANGDVRGAMNDLEMMLGAEKELMENLGIRDTKMEIFGVLDKIFLSESFDTPRIALAKSSVDTDMVLNWVDENIPVKYTSKESRKDAYENLAMASKFLEKASRSNYWGYLRYVSVLLSSGVSLSNDGFVRMVKPYAFPSKIKYMGSTKQERGALNGIAEKLSDKFHTNRKRIIRDYLPLMRAMLVNYVKNLDKEEAMEQIENQFGLDEGEIEYLLGNS
jgi:replication factor C large subunit